MLTEFVKDVGPYMDKIVEDLRTDEFFQQLSLIQQYLLIEKIRQNNCCAGHVLDMWHGEIKECPTCRRVRVTSCCACGCGSCKTCGYQFTCQPAFSYVPDCEKLGVSGTMPSGRVTIKLNNLSSFWTKPLPLISG